MVIRSGNYVEERLGVSGGRSYTRSLSIREIGRQTGDAVVGARGVVRSRRSDVPTHTRYDFNQHAQQDADTLLGEAGLEPDSEQEFYRLDDEDVYFVRFNEDVEIPEGTVGYVTPRENLLRCGVQMHATAVLPGDDDPEALLTLKDQFVLVEENALIAELTVVEAAED
ncbi:hypothetical protein BRD00_12700 [Halobacteriales archaeon QS_8_69_26]|nr:MAG: hypothetical protein BRD00_12700 [Halobacteriales archaeon QS_8_69_26]